MSSLAVVSLGTIIAAFVLFAIVLMRADYWTNTRQDT